MPVFLLPVALWLTDPWHAVLALVLAVLLYRPIADLTRFALAPPAARRHYPGMIRARHRWHWLCRCVGLGQPELAVKNRSAAESRVLVLVLLAVTSRVLAILFGIETAERLGKIHYPRAKRWRLTDYGWQCAVKTAPRTGRREVEKQAQHIADYWRSVRVGVTQAAPGRLIVRALREDPLAVPFGPGQCPPGTFEPHRPDVLYVGRDDFGADRYLPLRGLTGICVSGLPGYGKTSLINSWLCQLAPTPAVQFALLDGKDGGDQEAWHERAWRHAGDHLAEALDVLEDQHATMRRRLRTIAKRYGQANAWNAGGPTADLPLAVSFALKTTESSVAALGDAIREYRGYSPTLLRETPNGIGTAVVTLSTGTDPFTRLRVPQLTEQWAAASAAASACHRRDPYQVEAEPVPSQLPVVPAN
jgi:hypothetical protein